MDQVLEKLGEIAEQQGVLQTAVAAAQTKSEEFEAGQSTVKEGLELAKKDAADAMEKIVGLEGSIKSIEKTGEFLEKSMARINDSSGNEDNEMELRAHDEMCRYLRHGEEMSDEVKEAVVTSMTQAAYHGMSEEEKMVTHKSLIAGSNPDGGYFIRPERSAKMIQRIFETSPVRRVATIATTSSDALEFIIDDNEASSGGWVGETATRGDTDTPQIGKLTIPVHEQFSQPRATQKMLDDAGFDIESWLAGKVTSKMSRVENTAFTVGDGSLKPKGFLSYDAWAVNGTYERDAIEQIDSGAAALPTADGFKETQNSLIEDYQGGAVWTMKRASFLDVITLKDSTGRYIFQSRFIDDRDQMRLLGKEVLFMNDMPAVGANALAYAYGNFSEGYTVVDRIGFRVIRDIYTDKPYIKFYTTKRVGGAVSNYEAIKIMKMST